MWADISLIKISFENICEGRGGDPHTLYWVIIILYLGYKNVILSPQFFYAIKATARRNQIIRLLLRVGRLLQVIHKTVECFILTIFT